MSRICIALLLAILPLCGCGGSQDPGPETAGAVEPPPDEAPVEAPPPVEPEPRTPVVTTSAPAAPAAELEAGLASRRIKISSGGRPFEVLYARVDPARHRLELLADPSSKQPGRSLESFQRQTEAKVVLSGGFLKSFYPAIPLGLVRISEEVISVPVPPADLLNGLVGMSGERFEIAAFSKSAIEEYDHALQSGPLLALDGRPALPPGGEELGATTRKLVGGEHERAFVATGCGGDVVLGATSPVPLRDLVRFLLAAADEEGLGCRAALNLSGGAEAGILIRAGGQEHALGATDFRIANAIVVDAGGEYGRTRR